MSDSALVGWFTSRRESLIVKKTQQHLRKVATTAAEFDIAVSCMSSKDRAGVLKSVERLQISEKEADDIEDSVMDELSRGELPSKEREDLMHLIKRSDLVADWIKEASRNMNIIIETNMDVPTEIWGLLGTMSHKLSDASKALEHMMENFGKNYDSIVEHEAEVDGLEHEMDDIYFQIKKKFITSNLEPRTMIIMNDMLHSMENAADNCKNTSGMIHALVVAGK